MNGSLTHLGTLSHLIYGHDVDRNVELAFSFSPKGEASDSLIRFSVTLSLEESAERGQYQNAVKVARLGFTAMTDRRLAGERNPEESNEELEIKESTNSRYEISWKNFKSGNGTTKANHPTTGTAQAVVTFANFAPTKIDAINPSEQEWLNRVLLAFNAKREALLRVVEKVSYLGPLREEPARRYIYENEAVEIGVKGENAPYIYLVERYKPVDPAPFFLTSVVSPK